MRVAIRVIRLTIRLTIRSVRLTNRVVTKPCVFKGFGAKRVEIDDSVDSSDDSFDSSDDSFD